MLISPYLPSFQDKDLVPYHLQGNQTVFLITMNPRMQMYLVGFALLPPSQLLQLSVPSLAWDPLQVGSSSGWDTSHLDGFPTAQPTEGFLVHLHVLPQT